jgi:tRNA modification GTPase
MRDRSDAALLARGDDTILAIATAPGRGALAIVRLSGPAAHTIAARVLSPWPVAPRRASRCSITEPDSRAVIDRGIVTIFVAPRSYTGEDSVEITTHGGYLIPAAVAAALISAGARQALPGEFTRRAVMNGKMDLLQAEAVADLVDARSRAMHGAALAQLDGGLSRRVTALRESLTALEALIAYDIDFPEEDDGPIAPARIEAASRELLEALDALVGTASAGAVIRDGALVVIVGAPNVGKSSLFNALLGQARAIVSELPGTTRDAVEALLDAGGVPLRLVDTAGLREPGDRLEQLGIEVSERYMAEAQLVLACGDTLQARSAALARAASGCNAPVIGVATKRDGLPGGAGTGAPDDPCSPSIPAVVAVSAETGAGLEELLARIQHVLASRYGEMETDVPLLTRARHRRAVVEARDELAAFREAWFSSSLPAPVAATHLRAASVALEDLIGVIDVEDVLDRVFSSFCIGK